MGDIWQSRDRNEGKEPHEKLEVPISDIRKCNSKKTRFKTDCRMEEKPGAGPMGVSFEVFLGLPYQLGNILAGTV